MQLQQLILIMKMVDVTPLAYFLHRSAPSEQLIIDTFGIKLAPYGGRGLYSVWMVSFKHKMHIYVS